MKDAHDTNTAELFPVPKKRGRPKSDKTMTPAERQKLYRLRKQHKQCKVNLNCWIDESAKYALDELCKQQKLTNPELIEKLINDFKGE